jgi:alkyl sulfatase BDS1-like metallo-beta-lactamase superfamily hydrolase
VLVANSSAMLQHIPMEQFFNAIATLLNGDKAAGKQAVINLHFSDTQQQYVLWLENAVLHHRQGSAEGADFSLTLTRTLWQQLLLRQAGLSDLLLNDDFKLEGDRLKLLDFLSLLDQPQPDFAIVEP